jgi:hypothetical protein
MNQRYPAEVCMLFSEIVKGSQAASFYHQVERERRHNEEGESNLGWSPTEDQAVVFVHAHEPAGLDFGRVGFGGVRNLDLPSLALNTPPRLHSSGRYNLVFSNSHATMETTRKRPIAEEGEASLHKKRALVDVRDSPASPVNGAGDEPKDDNLEV